MYSIGTWKQNKKISARVTTGKWRISRPTNDIVIMNVKTKLLHDQEMKSTNFHSHAYKAYFWTCLCRSSDTSKTPSDYTYVRSCTIDAFFASIHQWNSSKFRFIASSNGCLLETNFWRLAIVTSRLLINSTLINSMWILHWQSRKRGMFTLSFFKRKCTQLVLTLRQSMY